MKTLVLLSIVFMTNSFAIGAKRNFELKKVSKTVRPVKWWCPPRSKFSKIGGDEPRCQIGHKLIQVEGKNLPDGYGCFACKGPNTVTPEYQTE